MSYNEPPNNGTFVLTQETSAEDFASSCSDAARSTTSSAETRSVTLMLPTDAPQRLWSVTLPTTQSEQLLKSDGARTHPWNRNTAPTHHSPSSPSVKGSHQVNNNPCRNEYHRSPDYPKVPHGALRHKPPYKVIAFPVEAHIGVSQGHEVLGRVQLLICRAWIQSVQVWNFSKWDGIRISRWTSTLPAHCAVSYYGNCEINLILLLSLAS